MNVLRTFTRNLDTIVGLSAAIAAGALVYVYDLESQSKVLLSATLLVIVAVLTRQLRTEKPIRSTDETVQRVAKTVDQLLASTEMLSGRVLAGNTSRRRRGSAPRIYRTRPEVYDAIAQTLSESMDSPGPKRLDLAALHGHTGQRRLDEEAIKHEFNAFSKAIRQCIRQSGSSWRVRQIFNITTHARLDVIAKRLEETKDADGFEVRTYCNPGTIPHLAPLVLVSDHVLIGLEDSAFFRIEKAFHVKDEAAAAIVSEYFQRLWEPRESDVFELRAGDRVRYEEIERLSDHISRLPV